MKTTPCIRLFLLLLLLFWPLTAMAFTVDLSDNRLSIDVQSIPLQQVLHDLARQGLTVKIDPKVNPLVTASFQDTELEHGLRILLKKVNHTLIWETPPGGTGEPNLTEIRVFRPGHRDALEELIAGENLAINRHPERGIFYVKDELLIRLKPGAGKNKLRQLVRQIGGKIIDSWPAVGVYRVQLPEDTDTFVLAEQLADDDKITAAISGAEPNYAYPITLPIHAPHETSELSDLMDTSKITGKAPIAILDSGLQSGLGLEDYVIASEDVINPNNPISDWLGHGTQMALVAVGIVTPYGADADTVGHNPVIPIRAFDDNGFTSSFHIMQSIDFSLRNRARVMSLSWGTENQSSFLETAFDYAGSKGMVLFAAAGNEPTGRKMYPAAYSSVIGVGALAPDGTKWKNSNDGDFVQLEAPGFAQLPVGYKADAGIYAGTSIATAYVANLASAYLAKHPSATREELVAALRKKLK